MWARPPKDFKNPLGFYKPPISYEKFYGFFTYDIPRDFYFTQWFPKKEFLIPPLCVRPLSSYPDLGTAGTGGKTGAPKFSKTPSNLKNLQAFGHMVP